MLSMASGQIPKYLKHFSFTPTEDTKGLTLDVGYGVTYVFITSNFPESVSEQTLMAAIIIPSVRGFVASINRLITKNANGNYDYWQPTSATHVWTYADGVISITWGTNYYLGEGIRYDVFYM